MNQQEASQAEIEHIPPVDHQTLTRVDKEKAFKLRHENKLTYQEIADICKTSKQAVWKAISNLAPPEDVEIYTKGRSDIFAGMQAKILSSIDEDAIKAASLLQRVTAAGILYDKERLESGKSTGNISVLISAIEGMQE